MAKIKKIAIIGGARPNFIKISSLSDALKKKRIDFFVVNTGQHFSRDMSWQFFKEFGLKINYHLEPSRKSVVGQFADIMKGLEGVFNKESPDLVLVVGDVNSTLAGALVANKMKIRLAHFEAGLRSYNREMPEEFNRVLTDNLSDFMFVTVEEGMVNLKKENLDKRAYFVGNVIIDTLIKFLPKTKTLNEDFYFCTLHRGENIRNKKVFREILAALKEISRDSKIYLPLHPHTKRMAEEYGLVNDLKKIFHLLPPLGYIDSLTYQKNAKLILTDSGGIQEEASFLGVPCLTLRNETERPITVKLGTSTIAGTTKRSILKAYKLKDLRHRKTKISLWDGRASERIAQILLKNV